MIDHFKLSVEEVLRRKCFQHAELLAGETGLQRMVKWTHIMEVTQIGKLLNGNELILSTGLGWKEDKECFISFLEQLIESNASGLCIELGTYISTIPQEIIELANRHHFPLIVFHKEVRFLDITQDLHALLGELYVEENRKEKETKWIQEWLNGLQSKEKIERYLSDVEPLLKPNGCVVCLCRKDYLEQSHSQLNYFNNLFATVFEQQGFFVISTTKKNQIIFILINKRQSSDWKSRIEGGIRQLLITELSNQQKNKPVIFAFGKFMHNLYELSSSYRSAKETLNIREKLREDPEYYFFEDLHIYRLIYSINEQGGLQDYIHDYLDPIIKHDQQHDTKLMKTLKTYLDCNGSKQETARRLFIVRQTLYHRIEKIKELLGNDFMKSDKRQAIEFALAAYEYTM